MLSMLPLLLLTTAVGAAQLTISSPRFTILSSNATELRSEPLSLTRKPAPLKLRPTDALRLSFQVTTEDQGQGVQPHQAFLRFYDADSGEEGIQPVRVAIGGGQAGKAKYELNMARPPSSLPPSGKAPLQVTLLLGSFAHAPKKIDLFDLYIPESQPPPVHPEEASFHPLPLIAHTFRPEQEMPPKIISVVFSLIVLTPFLVLLELWRSLGIRSALRTPHRVLPFTVLLGVFEVLLIWYWVDLKLGQVLLYGGILGVCTALAGKQALETIAKRRFHRQ